MNSIRSIQALNKRELEAGIAPSASWHRDFADTAFIYIGGLPFELSEGDIITIFSQFGEPVYVNLVRDKETGKSKGFAFLKYEDQRSCDLAVDNLGGATVMGRLLRVDHTRYKRKEDEVLVDNTGEVGAGGDDGKMEGDGKIGVGKDKVESEEDRPILKEERELAELLRNHDEDDPMKEYLLQQKREEVAAAIKEYEKGRRHHKKDERRHHGHRHHPSRKDKTDGEVEERRDGPSKRRLRQRSTSATLEDGPDRWGDGRRERRDQRRRAMSSDTEVAPPQRTRRTRAEPESDFKPENGSRTRRRPGSERSPGSDVDRARQRSRRAERREVRSRERSPREDGNGHRYRHS